MYKLIVEKKDELLLEELNELSYEEAIIEDKRVFFIFAEIFAK